MYFYGRLQPLTLLPLGPESGNRKLLLIMLLTLCCLLLPSSQLLLYVCVCVCVCGESPLLAGVIMSGFVKIKLHVLLR